MKLVNKTLAILLKERGFAQNGYKGCTRYSKTYDYQFRDVDNNAIHELLVPTEHEVIDWIFRFSTPQDEYERIKVNEELQFWYSALLESHLTCRHCLGKLELVLADEPYNCNHYQCNSCDSTYTDFEIDKNKFSLMYEFIGRLEEWFESKVYA